MTTETTQQARDFRGTHTAGRSHEELRDLVSHVGAELELAPAENIIEWAVATFGERFFHDFSHVRPYLPQSVRHAFGQVGAPLSFGERNLIELVDIYFFKDPWRTRSWRSFYVGTGASRLATLAINALFDGVWRASGGRLGTVASWLGVYRLKPG